MSGTVGASGTNGLISAPTPTLSNFTRYTNLRGRRRLGHWQQAVSLLVGRSEGSGYLSSLASQTPDPGVYHLRGFQVKRAWKVVES